MLRHKSVKLAVALSLSLAVTGCADDPDRTPAAQAVADSINVLFHHGRWRQVPATPSNQAEAIVFEQRVAFGGDTALLDRPGREAIDRLIAEADPAPGHLVRLSVSGDHNSSATFDRMTLQRLESIRTALSNRGYESALADDGVARVAALQPNEIGLTVTKMVAILPDCDQMQPPTATAPVYDRGYGCANAYNLGMMVADPADLAHGRPLDPADAERASLVITRYRLDDPLIDSLLLEDTRKQTPDVQ